MIPTSIDGTDITGATIDGTDVTEITVDGQTVFSPLPDSADILVDYDVSATTSTNSIPDTTGNQPDATGDTYTTTTANGVRLAQLRSDTLEADFSPTISLPVTIFWVSKHVSNQSSAYLWSNDEDGWHMENAGADWSYFTRNNATGAEFGTGDTNLNVFTMYIESSRFTHRKNGTDSFAGFNTSTDSRDFIEIYFGSYSTGAGTSDIDFGRWIMYDGDKRSIQSQVESFLAGLYGISI